MSNVWIGLISIILVGVIIWLLTLTGWFCNNNMVQSIIVKPTEPLPKATVTGDHYKHDSNMNDLITGGQMGDFINEVQNNGAVDESTKKSQKTYVEDGVDQTLMADMPDELASNALTAPLVYQCALAISGNGLNRIFDRSDSKTTIPGVRTGQVNNSLQYSGTATIQECDTTNYAVNMTPYYNGNYENQKEKTTHNDGDGYLMNNEAPMLSWSHQ